MIMETSLKFSQNIILILFGVCEVFCVKITPFLLKFEREKKSKLFFEKISW